MTTSAINKANVIKETEKAIYVDMVVFLYDETLRLKAWLPKSQIVITEKEGDTIHFNAKANWLLGAKVKDYLTYLSNNNYSMTQEMQTFLTFGNGTDITYCFC